MRETVENQMSFPWLFFKHSLLSVAVFVFLICCALLFSPFSSLLTCTVLLLSTLLLFKITQRKPITMDDLAKDEVVRAITHENQQESEEILEVEEEEEKESTEGDEVGQLQKNENLDTGSKGLSPESENIDQLSSSEDSEEVDWPFPRDVREDPACSDDSISDDDSLIEIELPEGNYFGPKEEPTVKSRPSLPDFLPETMFPQQDLMGLLAEINEMNEEENLIEIDISMGSIKCSRVEIEA